MSPEDNGIHETSYHPVDVRFFHERIIPFIRGEKEIDDLVEDAVRLAKVRLRTNAWGYALVRLYMDEVRRQEKLKRKQEGGGGLLGRLFGKPKAEPAKADEPGAAPSPAGAFNPHVHFWGRPFLVGRADVSAAIDRYLAAAPEDVDSIAREEILAFSPALEEMQPLEDAGHLLPDEDLARDVRGTLDVLQEAYAARKAGKRVELPSGEEVDPQEIFASDFLHASLQFASIFRPGWMGRDVWPSKLLAGAGIQDAPGWETPLALAEPMLGELPSLRDALKRELGESSLVGGYVRPENVSRFKAFLDENREALLAAPRKEGEEQGAVAERELGKIREALDDAERRKMGFCEAAEVYNGQQGATN